MTICTAWSRSRKGPCGRTCASNLCVNHTDYYTGWLERRQPVQSWVMADGVAPWPEMRYQIENGYVTVTPEYFSGIPKKEPYSDFYYWLLRLPYILPHHNQWLFSHRILMWFRYDVPLGDFFADCFSNPNFDPARFVKVLIMAASRSGSRKGSIPEVLQHPAFERLFYGRVAVRDWLVGPRAAWRRRLSMRMDLIRDDLMAVAWAPERISWVMTLDERQRWPTTGAACR